MPARAGPEVSSRTIGRFSQSVKVCRPGQVTFDGARGLGAVAGRANLRARGGKWRMRSTSNLELAICWVPDRNKMASLNAALKKRKKQDLTARRVQSQILFEAKIIESGLRMMGKKLVVESHVIGNSTYELRRVVCSKKNCARCPHGPYWYMVLRLRSGKQIQKYIGKVRPLDVPVNREAMKLGLSS